MESRDLFQGRVCEGIVSCVWVVAVLGLWVQGEGFGGGLAPGVHVLFPPPPPLALPQGQVFQGGRGLWSWSCCVGL